MATSALRRSSESGDDSSYSTRRSVPRRHRSLSRFSHRTPDLDTEVTPMRKGKFVNTVRGSGFPEISLDDLAVEFFDSFSGESEAAADSQRRGRSVSRVSNGGMRRLDADTESSRRRRSLSRQPSSAKVDSGSNNNSSRRRSISRQPREKSGEVDPGSNNSTRRRSVSRQPREKSGEIGNSRRRRSLSVVRRQIDNSESDVQVKSFVGGRSQNSSGSHRPAASDHRQSLKRSCSQNPIRYHDGYSSHSSAVTDDEGKDSSSTKHGSERIIRTIYAQNKATPKKRESLGNVGYAYQRKSHDDHHGISTFTKGYAAKLQESEERKRDLLAEIMLEEERGRELSKNLKEFITVNEANEKTSRMRKRSKDRRMSMCLTDEAEQYIDEFISNIEDTDFSSLEDERSESSSSFGLIKTQSTTVLKSVPVEMDGVMLPWLQWETPDDSSAALACLNNAPHTPDTKHHVWESDPAQESSCGQGTTIGAISSRGSWSPYESATKPVNPIRRLQIDVGEYLKRPNSSEILIDTWKLRHRISSGSLVLCSRSLF